MILKNKFHFFKKNPRCRLSRWRGQIRFQLLRPFDVCSLVLQHREQRDHQHQQEREQQQQQWQSGMTFIILVCRFNHSIQPSTTHPLKTSQFFLTILSTFLKLKETQTTPLWNLAIFRKIQHKFHKFGNAELMLKTILPNFQKLDIQTSVKIILNIFYLLGPSFEGFFLGDFSGYIETSNDYIAGNGSF